jgi:hypothetical protein
MVVTELVASTSRVVYRGLYRVRTGYQSSYALKIHDGVTMAIEA